MSHFGSIDKLEDASLEDLLKVGDIGEISAKGIKEFFEDENNRALIDKLRVSGLNFESSNAPVSDKFKGLTFVITGTLPGMTRDEATSLILKNGGKVSSSVSGKTSYLVEGSDAGSKAVKARTLGINIIDEAGLLSLLEQSR